MPHLLRSLLDIPLTEERFRRLATSLHSGEAVDLRASGSIRPFLLASLLEAEEGPLGPLVQDLIAYSTSSRFLRLRKQLGIALS